MEERQIISSNATRATDLFTQLQSLYAPQRTKGTKEKATKDQLTRIRQRPFRIGDFPSSVQIDLPTDVCAVVLNPDLTKQLEGTFFTLIKSPHITISREFSLRDHQISVFVRTLRRLVRSIPEFQVSLTDFVYLKNPENNTEFLSVVAVSESFSKLLDVVDSVLLAFCKEKYNEERVVHASFFSRIKSLDIPPPSITKLDFSPFIVTQIRFKVGDVIYSLPLQIAK
ncbi:hypothetical protein EIN_086390 [Entamoeba invadens IP1]|uniref:hypothetical protein n=1 Tax=Entamoeba invadens IP1 TaxID=370355 RepID=UPI0002C3D567|nr:hypothetical protein EIN_086390 [Entamoeba invadens IP1]ELP85367.1 hypothetical protein EIN_086390 [Entamoeba invadens IP1]|eukprot:XP_004184713.1 hypothetical protein EIN_086390 [Entamoeba invadens IP1]